jgi:hypothetical protein
VGSRTSNSRATFPIHLATFTVWKAETHLQFILRLLFVFVCLDSRRRYFNVRVFVFESVSLHSCDRRIFFFIHSFFFITLHCRQRVFVLFPCLPCRSFPRPQSNVPTYRHRRYFLELFEGLILGVWKLCNFVDLLFYLFIFPLFHFFFL